MIGMEMGEHQQIHTAAPKSAQIVGTQVPGVPPGAAAAVHHRRPLPRPEHHALSLSHVEHGHGKRPQVVGRVGKHQRTAQGHDAAAQRDQGTPAPQGHKEDPQGVGKGQPRPEISALQRKTGKRERGEAPCEQEKQPHRQGRRHSCRRPQRRAEQGQQGRKQPQREGQRHQRQTQQIRKW